VGADGAGAVCASWGCRVPLKRLPFLELSGLAPVCPGMRELTMKAFILLFFRPSFFRQSLFFFFFKKCKLIPLNNSKHFPS
jgi:hypothetical protein